MLKFWQFQGCCITLQALGEAIKCGRYFDCPSLKIECNFVVKYSSNGYKIIIISAF
jgi:hypothetical protein